jgi:acetyltransferase
MMGVTIRKLTAEEVSEYTAVLADLLKNVVDDGASIGFLPPLEMAEAEAYWRDVRASVATGYKAVLAAFSEAGQLIGAVQLGQESRPNGRHRAEVQKLMVHTTARRQGIAWRLMAALEAEAAERKLRLLVLDTREGDVSNVLYERMGYQFAGAIPGYALSGEGTFDTTCLYYKSLTE